MECHYSEADRAVQNGFPPLDSALKSRPSPPNHHQSPPFNRQRGALHSARSLSLNLTTATPAAFATMVVGWGNDPSELQDPKKVASSEGEEVFVCT